MRQHQNEEQQKALHRRWQARWQIGAEPTADREQAHLLDATGDLTALHPVETCFQPPQAAHQFAAAGPGDQAATGGGSSPGYPRAMGAAHKRGKDWRLPARPGANLPRSRPSARRLVPVTRFRPKGFFEPLQPVVHQSGLQTTGQPPEPVARQGTTGQVLRMTIAYAEQELVISAQSGPSHNHVQRATSLFWGRRGCFRAGCLINWNKSNL